VFFIIGQPFGTLNDICIGVPGLLSAALAWLLLAGQTGPDTPLSRLALGVAVVGALVAALGSVLVVFRFTGFALAGFYTELGNALIGLWLLALCFSVQPSASWPRGLVGLGLVAGAVMVLGFLAVPAIQRGLDSMDVSPWYVNVSYVSWLGTFILFLRQTCRSFQANAVALLRNKAELLPSREAFPKGVLTHRARPSYYYPACAFALNVTAWRTGQKVSCVETCRARHDHSG
jgi:hypothetical protein